MRPVSPRLDPGLACIAQQPNKLGIPESTIDIGVSVNPAKGLQNSLPREVGEVLHTHRLYPDKEAPMRAST